MTLQAIAFLKGLFLGLTIICVIIWFIHRLGLVHVYIDESNLENFSKFETELTTQLLPIEKSIEGLKIIQAELENAIATGETPYVIDPKKRFQYLKTSWPQVYEKVSHLIPKDGTYIFRLVGDEYKILALSQLCSLVSLSKPQYVDLPRKKYDYICQYYGVWSTEGERL